MITLRNPMSLSDKQTYEEKREEGMEENVEEVVKKEWYKEDFKTIASQIKEQESFLRLKRRWLMDLPLSKRERKRIEELLTFNDKILPESLLRGDDVGYEDIRTSVEKGFGARKCEMEHHVVQKDVQSFNWYNVHKELFHLLDDMTNRGLCSFLEILTCGMTEFEKTNWGMKRAIKDYLKTCSIEKNENSQRKLKLLCQLLKNPKNFHVNLVALSSQSKSYNSAAFKVLDGLEDLPFRTLSAMHRKLRGVRYIPSMQSPKSGWGRDSLVNVVRKRCTAMLLKLGEGNEIPETLASAFAVAGLTLKLMHNSPPEIDFRKFSPETEALQNDIARAIWLLNDAKMVSLIELKKLQLLLDPGAQLSNRSLRSAVRNILTDYLFECSDMDHVPDCLLEMLAIINGRPQLESRRKRRFSKCHSSPQEPMKEEIENEVECILTVSAQAKQIVWDLLFEHRFDQDYADAYMEDLGESDMTTTDDDVDSEEEWNVHELHRFHSHDPDERMESIGETNPAGTNSLGSRSETDNSSPLLSPCKRLNVNLESMHINEEEAVEASSCPPSPSFKESKMFCDTQNKVTLQHLSVSTGEMRMSCADMPLTAKENDSTPPGLPDKNLNWDDGESQEIPSNSADISKYEYADFSGVPNIVNKQRNAVNHYLQVQEACDKTSMVAYDLIGSMLDKFSMIDGLDLYQGDRSYLQNHASVPQCYEGRNTELQNCVHKVVDILKSMN